MANSQQELAQLLFARMPRQQFDCFVGGLDEVLTRLKEALWDCFAESSNSNGPLEKPLFLGTETTGHQGQKGICVQLCQHRDADVHRHHRAWDAVAGVRTRMRSLEKSRTIHFANDTLHIAVSSQTNVEVALTGPLTVALPAGMSEPFTEPHFYADDNAALAAQARENLAASALHGQ